MENSMFRSAGVSSLTDSDSESEYGKFKTLVFFGATCSVSSLKTSFFFAFLAFELDPGSPDGSPPF